MYTRHDTPRLLPSLLPPPQVWRVLLTLNYQLGLALCYCVGRWLSARLGDLLGLFLFATVFASPLALLVSPIKPFEVSRPVAEVKAHMAYVASNTLHWLV